ncbi:hypothetical protein D6779_01215 [Candidatus Parcubacteria bacterium]|nr:MAG: hypothetical protein D6779_01215 [Candidatus Parcubacteria bacterium]
MLRGIGKAFAVVMLFLLLVGGGFAFFSYLGSSWSYRNELAARAGLLEKEAQRLKEAQEKIRRQLRYYQVPENVVKELRSRFHYRKRNEKMLLLVPGTSQQERR